MSVIFTVKVDKLSDEKQQDGIQADLFSLNSFQNSSWSVTFNASGATKIDHLNEPASTRKKKSIIFQSSVYIIYHNCQTWCCMHFDVNKNIIYYI